MMRRQRICARMQACTHAHDRACLLLVSYTASIIRTPSHSTTAVLDDLCKNTSAARKLAARKTLAKQALILSGP